jgi:hypothetical protein
VGPAGCAWAAAARRAPAGGGLAAQVRSCRRLPVLRAQAPRLLPLGVRPRRTGRRGWARRCPVRAQGA